MIKEWRIGNWLFHIYEPWGGGTLAYWGLSEKDSAPSYMKNRIWIRIGWFALEVQLKGYKYYDSTNWYDDND